MIDLNLGSQGAKRQSWSSPGPAARVKRLREEHPKASPEDIARFLWDEICDIDDEMFVVMVEYATRTLARIDYHAHSQKSAESESAASESKQQRKQQEKEEVKAEAEKIATKITREILLNRTMPNGKKMRFCTGDEMVAMANAGAAECAAWLKIGKKAKHRLVGQALNEEQVRAILK